MKKKMFLTVVTVAVVAVSARAQTQYLTPGKAYTFTGTAASGGGTISYQWYRDGEPIAGAADISYTLPDNLAYGKNVEFKRGAVSSVCPHNTSYTDIAVITFCDLMIGGICWASTNVATANKFAPRPDMHTQFYQWNRLTAWAATGDVSGWSSADNSETWTVNPCPEGWRLPARLELNDLIVSGYTGANVGTKGNAVAGAFCGPNHASCTLPSNMSGCIFLPISGIRQYSDGALDLPNFGRYWSSTHGSSSSYDAYALVITTSSNNTAYLDYVGYGYNIRCVYN